MKKLMILLLALIALTSCAASVPQSMMMLENTQVLTEPAVEFSYPVELTACSRIEVDEDGTTLLEYQVYIPVMQVLREDGSPLEEAKTELEHAALAKADAFNASFDNWRDPEELQEVLEAAHLDRVFFEEENMEWTGPYVINLDCQVYQSGNLISVSGAYYSYTGGAHPNHSSMSWNFDLASGSFFSPELLCAEGSDFREAVATELLTQLEERTREMGGELTEMLAPDYMETLRDWTNYTVSFDESGMTISFAPYVLGAYALGELSFPLSYTWMCPHLGRQGSQLLGLDCGEVK